MIKHLSIPKSSRVHLVQVKLGVVNLITPDIHQQQENPTSDGPVLDLWHILTSHLGVRPSANTIEIHRNPIIIHKIVGFMTQNHNRDEYFSNLKMSCQKKQMIFATWTFVSKMRPFICFYPRFPVPTTSGWWLSLPLWQRWVRQLGWWNSQYTENKNMFQTTNQMM